MYSGDVEAGAVEWSASLAQRLRRGACGAKRLVGDAVKQARRTGNSGVKGLNAQLAVLSSPTCAPVIAASRLRKGNAVSGHGAHRLIGDALATARMAGASGQVMVRANSGYYRRDVVAAARGEGLVLRGRFG